MELIFVYVLTAMINTALLKEVLAVPTKSRLEAKMIAWLVRYFDKKNIPCYVDPTGNVYVTKGKIVNGERYPCVGAHTDSVHTPRTVEVVERNGRLIALDANKRQCGLGGDDKAGIYEALELIEHNDVIKGAFFVAEEIGCQGSREADDTFFEDVGYFMQFDSPCDDILTYTCDGTQLFPDTGAFIDLALPIFKKYGATNWQHHPFTDVSIIKRNYDFVCLNLPAGYFHMHSHQEYVLLKAVENAVNMGQALIDALGCRHFEYHDDPRGPEGSPALKVTYLHCHG